MRLRGSLAALPTPFRGGAVDLEALKRLVHWHLDGGTHGLVPCGTTGEAATLSADEFRQVVGTVVDEVAGRVPVVAGTGSNDTAKAIAATRMAAAVGADAALVVTPYYNKPPQRAMVEHFSRVADQGGLPLVLYNVPSRTGINLLPPAVAELHRRGVAVAIKEATADLAQIGRIAQLTQGDLPILSGDDFTILPTLAMGGCGVISVVANALPRDCARLVDAFDEGAMEEARRLQLDMLDLIDALFIESNPIPLKFVMAELGLMENELRLPLVPLAAEHVERVRGALRAHGPAKQPSL